MGITREKETFEKMIRIYCHDHHANSLCLDCRALMTELEQVLGKCPFGDSKPLCSKCSIRCMGFEDRAKVLDVMRYSGPQMIYRHPALTVLHFIDFLKEEPEHPKP